MTTFDQRTKAYENKFAHDAELQFKVIARRNNLLGLWAAGRLHLEPQQAGHYARAIVEAHVDHGSDEEVIRKILSDFSAAEIASDRRAVVDMLSLFEAMAREQILNDIGGETNS